MRTAKSAVPLSAGGTPRRRRWLRYLLISAGGLVALAVIGLVAARLYFSDAYLKGKLQAALKDALGRDVEITALETSLFSGRVTLTELRIPGAASTPQASPDARIARVQAEAALWPLIFSGATKLRSVKVSVEGPEIRVTGRWEGNRYVTNWDDVLEKVLGGPPGVWPKVTGLKALDFELSLRDGTLRWSDPALGESRLEKLELTAQQPGLGQATPVTLRLQLATPASPSVGQVDAKGSLAWIDANGLIGADTFRDISLNLGLKDVDVGYLARYARVQGQVAGGRYDWTLGRGVSGTLEASAPGLKAIHLSSQLDASGVVSLWDHGRYAAGNLPGRVTLDAAGGVANGAFDLGAWQASLALAGTPADLAQAGARRPLELKVEYQPGAATAPPFRGDFSARLDDLFATDVGTLLDLRGGLSGTVEGHAEVRAEAGQAWRADGSLQAKDLSVLVAGVRQPATFEANFNALITPGATGRPESAQIGLRAKSRPIQISTVNDVPLRITGLSDPQKLAASGDLTVVIHGRELWQEFGPLLRVVNLTEPLEEQLDGTLHLAGEPGKLGLELVGRLQRQADPPEPIQLDVKAGYSGAAYARATGEPFANFSAQIKGPPDQPLSLTLAGQASRSAAREVYETTQFDGNGDLRTLTRINDRVGKYVRFFLPSQYKVTGTFNQKGSSRALRDLDPQGRVIAESFSLKTDLHLEGVNLSGPALVSGKTPLEWKEDRADLHLELELRSAGGKNFVAIPRVRFDAGPLTLDGWLREADVGGLAGAAQAGAAHPQAWANALPDTSLTVKAPAAVIQRLQELGVFPLEPLMAGDLRLKAEYAAKAKLLRQLQAVFANPSLAVNASAPEVDVAALAACLETPGAKFSQWLAALPGGTLEVNAQPALFEVLRARNWLPKEFPFAGQLAVQAQYDRAGDRLQVAKLDFTQDEKVPQPIARVALVAEGGTPVEVTGLGKLIEGMTQDRPLLDRVASLAERFGRKLAVRQVTLSPAALCRLLQPPGEASGVFAAVQANVLRFPEPWTLQDLVLQPAAEAGTFDLSCTLQTPAAWHARAGPGQAPAAAPTASVSGLWRLVSLHFVLNGPALTFKGELSFDDAQLSCAAAGAFTYSKAAGVPCRLTFQGSRTADGSLNVAVLDLAGGPLGFALADFAMTAKGALSFEKLLLREGPITGTLTGFLLDPVADRLQFVFAGGTLDLARAAAFAQLPATFRATGAVEQTQVEYAGRWSVFPGNLTAADQLSFRGSFKDAHLAGQSAGRTTDLTLNGALTATPFRLSSQQLTAQLDHAAPGKPPVREQLSVALDVAAKAPGTPLLTAFAQPGMPVLIRLPLEFKTPFDLLATLDGVATLAAAASPQPAAGGAGDLSAINQLRLEMTASAPSFAVGDLALQNLKASSIVMDQLVVTMPSAQAEAYGGQLAVSDASYNLAGAAIKHAQKVALTNVDLHALTSNPAHPAPPDSYQVYGRLTGTGTLNGTGFNTADRRSWQGDLKATVTDLIAQKGQGKKTVSPTKMLTGILGTVVGGPLGAGMNLFSSDYGLFLERMEFEPCEISIQVRNGVAQVAQGLLTGRGQNAGLQVGFVGTVDLPTETLNPNFKLWPTTLPPATQKALGMGSLPEADRRAILQEFANGDYCLVLTGPVSNPNTNMESLALKFTSLMRRVNKQAPAGQAAPANPAGKVKGTGLPGLLEGINFP